MKKRLMAMLLVAALAVALVIPVSAVETASGFYGIGTAANLTVTPNGTPKASELANFYADSDRLTVTYTAATPGSEYLVMLVSGDALPTASDEILYIDQKTATGATVEFTVYPTLHGEEEMTLFITSNAPGFETIGVPVKYYTSYTLGDVDGEQGINAYDASLVLQYCVGTYDFVGNGALAADVDGEQGVNAYDASLILQFCVGAIDSFN